jgi:hypothetical protein
MLFLIAVAAWLADYRLLHYQYNANIPTKEKLKLVDINAQVME